MEMREEESIGGREGNLELIKPLGRAAAAVKQHFFRARLHQDAGPKTLHHRARVAGAE
jgi:hypothetical protein